MIRLIRNNCRDELVFSDIADIREVAVPEKSRKVIVFAREDRTLRKAVEKLLDLTFFCPLLKENFTKTVVIEEKTIS